MNIILSVLGSKPAASPLSNPTVRIPGWRKQSSSTTINRVRKCSGVINTREEAAEKPAPRVKGKETKPLCRFRITQPFNFCAGGIGRAWRRRSRRQGSIVPATSGVTLETSPPKKNLGEGYSDDSRPLGDILQNRPKTSKLRYASFESLSEEHTSTLTTNTTRSTKFGMASIDDDAVAAADKEMEERANRAKELLSQRYRGLRKQQEERHHRKMQLERQMIGLPEQKKHELRRHLEVEENLIQKEVRRKITPADFESLAVIGRGAFGEVRLVRRKGKREDPQTGQIFALKSMKKEMMVLKNQVHHVKAERDALAKAQSSNRWLTVLHYSFFDETHLYMAMEYMPGGDLMSLLIKEDTFSEQVTRVFMAEAAQAISSVHALGYIHRDIKPDNMLLDARGHLKLTDLGLCKKVGDVSPHDEPEVVLEMMRNNQDGGAAEKGSDWRKTQQGGGPLAKHRTPDDTMAMSIDDGAEPGQKRDAKTRREMAYSTVGTPDYIAPEVLAAQNGASGYSYTCAVDWWSLGVIMFECLVGYTPFYADDPVTTCRKILRWRQCLEMPSETKSQLSRECIDFLSCLLAGPESRIGSSKSQTDFENGFKQVVKHPWFSGFDWDGLRDTEGPLLPSGSREFPELLEYLKTCPKSDPRFKQLVARVTQNFDTFEDFGTNLDSEGKTRVQKNSLDQFYNYDYRRVRKPRVPLPEMR